MEQVYRGERKLRPKSHHGVRRLPLSPGIAVALDKHRQASGHGKPDDPVFASTTGTPMDYSALRAACRYQRSKRQGLDWPKGQAFHMFRKTAASLIHDNGKTGRQLADWLGHHDPAFTIRTYVGQVDHGLGDAAFLDELIPLAGEGAPGDVEPHSDEDQGDTAERRLPGGHLREEW
jgi:integrase